MADPGDITKVIEKDKRIKMLTLHYLRVAQGLHKKMGATVSARIYSQHPTQAASDPLRDKNFRTLNKVKTTPTTLST